MVDNDITLSKINVQPSIQHVQGVKLHFVVFPISTTAAFRHLPNIQTANPSDPNNFVGTDHPPIPTLVLNQIMYSQHLTMLGVNSIMTGLVLPQEVAKHTRLQISCGYSTEMIQH